MTPFKPGKINFIQKMISKFLYFIKCLRFIPAIIIFKTSSQNEEFEYELYRWSIVNRYNKSGIQAFLHFMYCFPEYRSLFYHRTGKNWLRHFAKGQTNLYFHTPSKNIGIGLVIWHGYSTVINAQSIGKNCSIWHNVTIGKKTTDSIEDRPKIGNDVNICTGVIATGNIRIADGVTLGAGSVVVDSILKEGSVVVGQKARVISK